MSKTRVCACGIKIKVHGRKSRRGQLPGVKTDRFGRPRPGPGRRATRRKAGF